jgi:hypothetical protein
MTQKEEGIILKSGTREYLDIHLWLIKNYGKANHCEYCNKPAKRFEWALLKENSHEYNVKNYIQLCPSCHRKYDVTEESKIKRKEWWKNHPEVAKNFKMPASNLLRRGEHHSAKKIISIDKNGITEYFPSLTSAYDKYGYKLSSLSACLRGKNKTSHGKKWEFIKD